MTTSGRTKRSPNFSQSYRGLSPIKVPVPDVPGRTCAVCEKPFVGAGDKTTCGPLCARVWRKARYMLSGVESVAHRLHMARYTLLHAEQRPASLVNHSLLTMRAWVNQQPLPVPKTQFFLPHSQAFQAALTALGTEEAVRARIERTHSEIQRICAEWMIMGVLAAAGPADVELVRKFEELGSR